MNTFGSPICRPSAAHCADTPPTLRRFLRHFAAMSGDRRRSRNRNTDYHSVATSSRRVIKKGKCISVDETLSLKQRAVYGESNLSLEPTVSSSHKRAKPSRRKSSTEKGCRKWVYSSRDCSGFEDKVILVSYNILGVENASNHPDLYCNARPEWLAWNKRKKIICREVRHYCPDILCFQEVDRFQDLNDRLHKDGFRGAYKARTGDANDGCAIFWKDERFTLLHEAHIEFQKFGLRNNVAQFCILKKTVAEDKDGFGESTSEAVSSRCFVVGNIHVLFNPNRGDVKLGQIRLFLEKAHELSEEWGGIPIVLAGDLNSVPQSAVYQFMTTEKLDILSHDRKRVSGQIDGPFHHRAFYYRNGGSLSSRSCLYKWNHEELKLATGNGQKTRLQNPLKLFSAYHGVPGNSKTRDHLGEPLATSYHSKSMGTVDYIWHTEDLAPVRVLDIPPVDALRKIGGLPSQQWGSDHLALVCEFAFMETSNQS